MRRERLLPLPRVRILSQVVETYWVVSVETVGIRARSVLEKDDTVVFRVPRWPGRTLFQFLGFPSIDTLFNQEGTVPSRTLKSVPPSSFTYLKSAAAETPFHSVIIGSVVQKYGCRLSGVTSSPPLPNLEIFKTYFNYQYDPKRIHLPILNSSLELSKKKL